MLLCKIIYCVYTTRYFVLFLDYFIVPCLYVFVSTLRNILRNYIDDSYTDSKYNRHCDVTIYFTVQAAKLCKRGSVEVSYIIPLMQANAVK